MKAYLYHLLYLIERRAKAAPKPDETSRGGAQYIRLDELMGVPYEMFPASGLLDEQELALLTGALRALWRAYRVYPDLPENLPIKRQYELLVGRMGGAAIPYYMTDGAYLEFCWYDPAECPFGSEFCQCKRWLREAPALYFATSARRIFDLE